MLILYYVILRKMVKEIIARVSSGAVMDQIYIPKNRQSGFEIGNYVVIEPTLRKPDVAPSYYNTGKIAPIKSNIILELFRHVTDAENVIITGSFLENGFRFDDLDVILINGRCPSLEMFMKDNFGISVHIIEISYAALREGMNTDPLFQMMLDKFVAKEKVLFKVRPIINYKLLDLHLLKSKQLVDNFDLLTGQEKYKMLRNVIAIKSFIEGRKITNKAVDYAIELIFGKGFISSLRYNILKKEMFIKKYKQLYGKIFSQVMEGIQYGTEQAEAH